MAGFSFGQSWNILSRRHWLSTKVCRKCGVERLGTEFSPRAQSADGLNNHCKPCRNALSVRLRKANPEKYRGHVYKFYATHPEKANITSRRWAANNPEKVKAKTALNHALRAGKVQKWPCEVCGESKVEAHHADYDNVLGVTWLCHSHHKLLHAQHRKSYLVSAPVNQQSPLSPPRDSTVTALT